VSYILDALRKSEQQRQLGVAPRLLTVHATSDSDAPPAFLKYGLLAAALIGAGVAIGWWHPWQQEQLPSATASASAGMPEVRPPDPIPVPLPVLPAVASGPDTPMPAQRTRVALRPIAAPEVTPLEQDTQLPAPAPPQTRKPPPAAAVRPQETATPVREAAPAPASAPARAPAPAPAPRVAVAPIAVLQEKSAAPADPAQQQKLLAIAELPPAIRQEIPAMAFPVHSYSDTPQERIVGINDQLLREGEYLAPGLKLERIAPDGVVFSYKNYLFRHGL
jgi:general secretion pathway protein B